MIFIVFACRIAISHHEKKIFPYTFQIKSQREKSVQNCSNKMRKHSEFSIKYIRICHTCTGIHTFAMLTNVKDKYALENPMYSLNTSTI